EAETPRVQGGRPGHGCRAQHRLGGERLHAVRPRHLDLVQEPRRTRHRGRGRRAPLQPIRRDPGEPGQVPAREQGARSGFHRLARLRGRPECNCLLLYRGPAAVLCQRQYAGSLMRALARLGQATSTPAPLAERSMRIEWRWTLILYLTRHISVALETRPDHRPCRRVKALARRASPTGTAMNRMFD